MPKDGGWILPDVIDPPRVCVQLEIPNEPHHIAAFWGALLSLAYWFNWQRDDEHTGVKVGSVWFDVFNKASVAFRRDAGPCDGPTPPAITIQEWEDTLAICESLRWNNGVLEGLCCGKWTPISVVGDYPPPGVPNQPDGTSRPAAGESKCYNVTLDANNRWQLPFAVLPGDTVTISNITGTWSDGGLSPWFCPNGMTAVFGLCTGSGQGHAGGDPDATLYHMQLMAIVGSSYISGTGGAFVVGGSGSQTLTLQANDGSLSDNSGSLQLKICVESGETPPLSDWCYVMDFTLTDYGWVGTAFSTVWSAGVGWHGSSFEGQMDLAFPVAASLTYAKVTFDTDGTDHPCNGSAQDIGMSKNGSSSVSWFEAVCDIYAGQAPVENTSDLSILGGDNLRIGWYNTAASFFNITRIELHGTGVNPFGTSNC